MEVKYTTEAIADLIYWKKSGNKIVQKKITELLFAIQENPYQGIGKPESLKYELLGKWSRRINLEHRIVYSIVDEILVIHRLKDHY